MRSAITLPVMLTSNQQDEQQAGLILTVISLRLVTNVAATLHGLSQQLRFHVQNRGNCVAFAFASAPIRPRPPFDLASFEKIRACSRRPPPRKAQRKAQHAGPGIWDMFARTAFRALLIASSYCFTAWAIRYGLSTISSAGTCS